MLIKRFVNVNSLRGVETGEGRESGQPKEEQEKQGGQEKGNKISRMKQKIKSQSILKSDSHNINGNYDNNNSNVNKKKDNDGKIIIDIKGTISIAITITSFLIALTQLQTGNSSSNNTTDSYEHTPSHNLFCGVVGVTSILHKDRE